MEEQDASLPENPTKNGSPEQLMRSVSKESRWKRSIWIFSESEKTCPVCGTVLKQIGEEFVRRELVFIPAKLKVCEHYSRSYECPQCSRHGIPVIKKGKDGRPHMLYGMASAGTVAWVMYQKFCNALPYFRQEKDWKQYGASITRATMANWRSRIRKRFSRQCMNTSIGSFWNGNSQWQTKLRCRCFMSLDAAPRQSPTCGCSGSGKTDHRRSSFINTRKTRAGDNAVDFLQGFKGYLMCDGYSGYNKVPDAKRTSCWAHIRRYLDRCHSQRKGIGLPHSCLYRA